MRQFPGERRVVILTDEGPVEAMSAVQAETAFFHIGAPVRSGTIVEIPGATSLPTRIQLDKVKVYEVGRPVDHIEATWHDAGDRPATPADQAVRVRGWLELQHQVPRLVVVNASEAEIRNVVPTPTLVAMGDDGQPDAMVGGSPLGRVAEISPGAAFIVDLPHYANWARGSGVESRMHIEFDDARGQRWQMAHGQVIAIEKPLGAPIRTAEGQIVDAQTLDLAQPVAHFMSTNADRVAFLSYVHEDHDAVDQLQEDLEAAGVTVWRDLDRLLPGENKRQKIRNAIRKESFAFLSCFSAARAARAQSYVNEELSIALDELRTHTNASWFIPVRLDDTPMPDLHLGHHGALDDIIWVNLFGDRRAAELSRLIAGLRRLV